MKFHFFRIFTILFCLVGVASFADAQKTVVQGTVKDETSRETLIGANILIKGTTTGTVSDYDGNFSITTDQSLPVTLVISYTGYQDKEVVVDKNNANITVLLSESAQTIETVEVTGQRISEKQKAAPLTIESMDLVAIKQTASDNFYDGLGAMKGVDLTAASLGFKIINTRGFNSTSPVRSLQLIDGVDNQAPGLNFSLGNFLGSSELDVLKVDLIQGASSAFYGPNAFNGVIAMETKNPFIHRGLSASVKAGERQLLEGAIRYADHVTNKEGLPFMAYKINASGMKAYDWVADNYDPVYNTVSGKDNAGGWDAVNIYGDEYNRFFDERANPVGSPAMGLWHRQGYKEIDIVDYNSNNFKVGAALHFRLNPAQKEQSAEFIAASNIGGGTTVYQGDNRFSLRNIRFFQHRVEVRKQDKWFVRLYTTKDDAGDSFDPYFTALRLQSEAKSNSNWAKDYVAFWSDKIRPQVRAKGYPEPFIDPITFQFVFDTITARNWVTNNYAFLVESHRQAAESANKASDLGTLDFYAPGTPRFQEAFDRIRSAKSTEGGTRFFDRSSLYHGTAEYKFNPGWVEFLKAGVSARLYRPNSEGTIFVDTVGNEISNFEFGVYAGADKKFFEDKLTASVTFRVDKNQNFDFLASPAASLVFKPKDNNYLRLSFSSAIRNPTLTDQYLNLNVGPAILAGNLNGVQNLITVNSFIAYLNTPFLDRNQLRYFDIDPIKPEQVRTLEGGYRTSIGKNLYIDAGVYFSWYKNFIGYNIGVRSGFTSNGFPVSPQVFRFASNSKNIVTTQGVSIGATYYFADYFAFNGNYSWNKLNVDDEILADPIIPAFNTPEHKFNVGISGRDIRLARQNFSFNVNYKWVEGFLFEGSPQFTGFIPSYGLLDAQVSLEIIQWKTTLKIGASNVLNNLVFQTYGGPRIGRLAYASLLYEFKKKS
jgi:outer membrane receptor protein involved in Fe transport